MWLRKENGELFKWVSWRDIAINSVKRFLCIFFWFLALPIRILILVIALGFSCLFVPLRLLSEAHDWACKGNWWSYNPFPFYRHLFWNMFLKGEVNWFLVKYCL